MGKVEKALLGIEGSVRTSGGEIAWPAAIVPNVLNLALENKWIVLDGKCRLQKRM